MPTKRDGTQKKAQQEQSSTSSTTTTTRIGGRRGKYSTLHNPTLHNNNNTKSSAALNTIFAEYWPDDLVTQGLADGQLLRGQLRLNLTNPSEGYITIPGIRYDLLVKGQAQNRAITGDTVAVRVLRPSHWYKIKSNARGGASPSPSNQPAGPSPVAQTHIRKTPRQPSNKQADNQGFVGVQHTDTNTGASPTQDVHGIPDNVAWLQQLHSTTQDPPIAAPHASHGGVADHLPGLLPTRAATASGMSLPSLSIAADDGDGDDGDGDDGGDDGDGSGDDGQKELGVQVGEGRYNPVDSIGDTSTQNVGNGSAVVGNGGAGAPPCEKQGEEKPAGVSMLDSLLSELTLAPGTVGFRPYVQAPWYRSNSQATAARCIDKQLAADGSTRAVAEVVAILDPSPLRSRIVGVLQRPPTHTPGTPPTTLQLISNDPRIPLCIVPVHLLPEQHKDTLIQEAMQGGRPGMLRTLVVGAVGAWPMHALHPTAEVCKVLGPATDLVAETEALLAAAGCPTGDFSDEVIACLPDTSKWQITAADLAQRTDYRTQRVFSIDPPTAKDLDDALSVQQLPNGLLRVGVHIADVSHFVLPGTVLDDEASSRATSVYLVEKVIPMLPPLLCVPRLTFTIEFDIDPTTGTVQQRRPCRSVIQSCAKLTYGVAQSMLDGMFDEKAQGVPTLHGGHAWQQVVEDVFLLNGIAEKLRAARFAQGALRIDGVKLRVQLGSDGKPLDVSFEKRTASNYLVEEFMLLANIHVAQIISEAFPDRSMLRCHPPPNQKKLHEAKVALEHHGFTLDITSAGTIQKSMMDMRSRLPPALMDSVAKYFSTGTTETPQEWYHYALAVPHYTHFTSPIRRFPDIEVHRLLAAVIGEGGSMLRDADSMATIATHCNERKEAAKKASEKSAALYLYTMLYEAPRVLMATIMAVNGSQFFDIYIPALGIEHRVQVADTRPAVRGLWDPAKRQLHLRLDSSKRPKSCLSAITNNDKLINEDNIPLMPLPLVIAVMTQVPVVVSAQQHEVSGSFEDALVRLYVGAGGGEGRDGK